MPEPEEEEVLPGRGEVDINWLLYGEHEFEPLDDSFMAAVESNEIQVELMDGF